VQGGGDAGAWQTHIRASVIVVTAFHRAEEVVDLDTQGRRGLADLIGRGHDGPAGGAISSLSFCALSYLVFGEATWRAFLQNAALAQSTLENGLVDPAKMQSLYAAVRVLHGGLALAAVAQTILAIVVAALLAKAAARRPGGTAEGALTVSACLLCTPFLLDYDLVCLALPLAWVTARAQETGWRPWEKIALLMAYALPAVSRSSATFAGLPVGPLVMLGLFAVVWRRASS
jgi:alpha-1,2-mannosyltransferase